MKFSVKLTYEVEVDVNAVGINHAENKAKDAARQMIEEDGVALYLSGVHILIHTNKAIGENHG